MTSSFASRFRLLTPSSAIVAGAMLAAALGVAAPAVAQQHAPAQQTVVVAKAVVELERAFWYCDHAATTVGVDSETGIMCVAVTEDLKQKKFDGDYDALLSWWQQHKAVQHRALNTAASRASR